jgi:hypothetical protein
MEIDNNKLKQQAAAQEIKILAQKTGTITMSQLTDIASKHGVLTDKSFMNSAQYLVGRNLGERNLDGMERQSGI